MPTPTALRVVLLALAISVCGLAAVDTASAECEGLDLCGGSILHNPPALCIQNNQPTPCPPP